MRLCVVTILALSLLGCASDRFRYAPVTTTGADLAGAPAAVYALPPESPHGDVRLATSGIASLRPQGIGDSTLPAIHVALVVSNRSRDETWSVDGAEQKLALAGHGGDLVTATTAQVTRPAPTTIAAGSTERLDLFFPLPAGLSKARDLPAFEMIWTVRIGSRVIAGRTPFGRFVVGQPPRPAPALTAPGGLENEAPLPGDTPPNRRPPHAVP